MRAKKVGVSARGALVLRVEEKTLLMKAIFKVPQKELLPARRQAMNA
jgi:hypothetical protein